MSKENYVKLEEDIVDFFNERLKAFEIPITIKFVYLSATNIKQLIKLTRIPDHYSVLTGKDILVSVNPNYYDAISDEKYRIILFDKEIDKIQFDLNKGTFKIGSPNFKANVGLIEKYSYEEVQKAIESEKLYETQKKEQEEEKQSAKKPSGKKYKR